MAHLGPHLYSEDSDVIIEPASDVFEIDDFTSPSDWEKFVARLEHLIREWGLNDSDALKETRGIYTRHGDPINIIDNQPHLQSKNWIWKETSTTLTFYDFQFLVKRFWRVDTSKIAQNLKGENDLSQNASNDMTNEVKVCNTWRGKWPPIFNEMLSPNVDFPPKYHPIHDYFGINDFVILSPNIPHEKEDIDNETRAKIALSTVTVAVHNTNCQVPFFVQVMDRSKYMYNGVFSGYGFRTNFEMIVMSKKPPHASHLAGLLAMFKKKISPSIDIDIPSIKVTVRCSYGLNDWTSHAWSQAPPDFDIFSILGGKLEFVNDISCLPFGSTSDPVKKLILYTTWCDLQEDIITDNDVHTDLEPLEAPMWSIGVKFEQRPFCLLSEYLNEFSKLGNQHETLKELLGDITRDDMNQHLEKLPNVFNRLTGPTYTLTDIIQSGKSPIKSHGGPIKDEYLTTMLEYLFPDSIKTPRYPYPSEFESHTTHKIGNNNSEHYRVSMGGIKSSPIDGLVWRLGIVLGHCLHVLGGIKPFAHLINEFVLEVRYRWESAQKLPGMPSGSPDHSHCLLQQKLQMINCCIEKKLSRESKNAVSTMENKVSKPNASDSVVDPSSNQTSDSEEDEFFECNESDTEDKEMEDIESVEETSNSELPVWHQSAEGRQNRFGKLKLLLHDDWLYVPICQDPTPMTEDMLAEQAEVII